MCLSEKIVEIWSLTVTNTENDDRTESLNFHEGANQNHC